MSDQDRQSNNTPDDAEPQVWDIGEEEAPDLEAMEAMFAEGAEASKGDNAPQDQDESEAADPSDPLDALAQAAHDAELDAEQAADQAEQVVESELDELKARLQRLSADYQNYVTRAQAETGRARQALLMDVARALVSVLDHFDHALQVDPETADAKTVLQGVEIAQQAMLSTLQQFGIQRIDAKVGDAFDPNVHEALMRQPSEEVESDHVAMQIQPGYVLNDVTVRPAKVGIAE